MINLFTKEYVEKCVNNPDLQSIWEPKESNFILEKEFNNLFCLGEVEMCQYENIFEDNFFYIPRQDELQIILKQKIERFKNMNDLKFDFNMRQTIFTIYCHKILSTLSLNSMWLIFLMKSLFDKQWVPESKSWEKR